MEQKQSNTIKPALDIYCLTSRNIFLILSFLDSDSVNAIIQADAKHTFKKCTIFSFARGQRFLQSYLNKTDRSIYMPFYSEPLFIKMEQQQLQYVCSHSAPVLNFFSNSFKGLFNSLQNYISDFQMSTEVVESITESLTDPQLPFPKLRKQNIGMHCNSAFQFFLVDKLFISDEEETAEETFEELIKYLSQKWDLSKQDQLKQIAIIEEVFSSWFKISYQNYQNYLIPRNTNHNLVILMIALLDLLIDSISFYIESIQDPLYSFIEFNMRYCIFRNIVLSLEQKLGFLFKNYSSFCQHILQKKKEFRMQDQNQDEHLPRQMTIWHCGLSKWYIYMHRHHETYFKHFFYLLKKINLQTIKEENSQKVKQDKTFIQLQNRLDFHEIYLLQRSQIFEVFSPIQDIFQKHKQLYSQVIKEYVQYIVDISINQYTVHWCGHSAQALHIPYQQFENLLLEDFKQYFFKIVDISRQVNNPILAIDSIINSIVHQLDMEYLKPITLKKITEFAQFQVTHFIGEVEYQKLQLFQTLKALAYEFNEKDKLLNHFNEISKICNQGTEKYSIVLQSEDFYKALKTSASTTASRNSINLPLSLTLNSNDSIMEEDFP